jgi:hypothetical protein
MRGNSRHRAMFRNIYVVSLDLYAQQGRTTCFKTADDRVKVEIRAERDGNRNHRRCRSPGRGKNKAIIALVTIRCRCAFTRAHLFLGQSTWHAGECLRRHRRSAFRAGRKVGRQTKSKKSPASRLGLRAPFPQSWPLQSASPMIGKSAPIGLGAPNSSEKTSGVPSRRFFTFSLNAEAKYVHLPRHGLMTNSK